MFLHDDNNEDTKAIAIPQETAKLINCNFKDEICISNSRKCSG